MVLHCKKTEIFFLGNNIVYKENWEPVDKTMNAEKVEDLLQKKEAKKIERKVIHPSTVGHMVQINQNN